jgi:hypothetical protein
MFATVNSQRRKEQIMSVKLNRQAFDHAKELIGKGCVMIDARDAWSEHQPSAEEENEFISQHGFDEYAKWHLGIDDAEGKEAKGRYKFPYGDFKNVHRCALLSAESQAGQYKHYDIESAAHQLHGMIEVEKKVHARH